MVRENPYKSEADLYIGSGRERDGLVSKVSDKGKTLVTAVGITGAAAVGFTNRKSITSFMKKGLDAAQGGVGQGISKLAQSSKYSKALNETSTYMKAMKETLNLKEQGLKQAFSKSNNFDSRFRQQLSKQIDLANRPKSFQIEEEIATLMHSWGPKGQNYQVAKSALLRDRTKSTLSNNLKKQGFSDKVINNATEILTNQRSTFFSNPNEHAIKAMVDNYSPEGRKKTGFANELKFSNQEEQKRFMNTMFDTLSSVNETLTEKDITRVSKNMRDIQYKNLKERAEKRKNFANRFMENTGARHVTVDDAIRLNLFDSEDIMTPTGIGSSRGRNMGERIKQLRRQDEGVGGLIVDSNLFIDKKGELVDLRNTSKAIESSLDGFQKNFQIPFLRFNPLDLTHRSTRMAKKNAPKDYFLRQGTIEPFISRVAKTQRHPLQVNQDAEAGMLSRDYLYSGNSIYDVLTGEKIQDNMTLMSSRFGVSPRAAAGMANLHQKDYGNRSMIGRLFDVGAQETPSVFSKIKGTISKFDNPDWEPNTLSILRGGEEYNRLGLTDVDIGIDGIDLSVEGAYKNLYSFTNKHTKSLSRNTIEKINPYVKDAYGDLGIDLTKINTEEEILQTIVGLADKGQSTGNAAIDKAVYNMASGYKKNPEEFMKGVRIYSPEDVWRPQFAGALEIEETELVTRAQDMKRLIHAHAVETTNNKLAIEKKSLASVLKEDLLDPNSVIETAGAGKERNKYIQEIQEIQVFNEMQRYWDDVYSPVKATKEGALKDFYGKIKEDGNGFADSLEEVVGRHAKPTTVGPQGQAPQYFGYSGYQVVGESKKIQDVLFNKNRQVAAGESPILSQLKDAGDYFGQFFSGRHNLDKVTETSLYSYQMANRLDSALSNIGLGLSQKNKGSAQSILFNQFGRRIVLPMVAMHQIGYFDDMTGNSFSEIGAEGYVGMHMAIQSVKEFTGINRLMGDFKGVFQGAEQLKYLPPVGIANALSFGTLYDDRSAEEVKDYYEYGSDPIRSGRFWGIGSTTPWQGGRIDHYKPNWYRRLKSDWEYSENTYGSRSEYYANHWIPTLTNPLSPLKHFVTDPYYWEEKHAESKPYGITGGFDTLQSIPIVGPAIDGTIGRILKPRKEHPDLEKAHEAYLHEINNYIKSQYGKANLSGSASLGGGGYSIDEQYGYGVIGSGGGSSPGGAGGTGGGGSLGDIYSSISMSGGTGGEKAKLSLAQINANVIDGNSPIRSISSLNDLRDPFIEEDLKNLARADSLGGIARETFYSATELAGIYGFSLKTLLGWDESNPNMILEDSSRMNSYAKSWWDMELGGLGGDVSEIGRRYNPRDSNKHYWNPIKNDMPSWLPGVDYMIDFQHGNPYGKIKNGEMRLPGEAYEKLHQLHPDQTGEYGIFDRYRILADVAPYSKEYRFYRGLVADMNEDGLLTEEMKKQHSLVREQVKERGKKFNFYNRRFRDADIKKEKVTVTKIIDQQTFLTEEYGMNPIKLAGIGVSSEDTEAIRLIEEHIKPGQKLEIGLDADPLHRVRDDVMETMRAVVYTTKNEEGNPIQLSNKGQNLNYMLANRSGLDVTKKDDGSAIATRALYDDTMITVGKAWEFLTHDVLSTVPVVNTIADKFMPIKSPLEMYKQQEIYGKQWRPWTQPFKGWIQPMLDKMSERNPIISALQGAGIGFAFTRGPVGKRVGTAIGGLVGGLVSTRRVIEENMDRIGHLDASHTWIPNRREKEREIEEYFDRLEYIKYKGLYEKTRKEAIKREGVDIEEIIEEGGVGIPKSYLEKDKKWLSIQKKLGYGEDTWVNQELEKIRNELESETKENYKLGPLSMKALQYKAAYESTVYGADPNGNYQQIMASLPDKDKEFFTEFMKASPKDREEILRLVPKNQRKFYQAKWGLDVDKQESNESFFSDKELPGIGWEGWEAGSNLDNYKVKVVKNEGLEMTEFGLWADEVRNSEEAGVETLGVGGGINPLRPVSNLVNTERLKKVLAGRGLSNVNISMSKTASEENILDINFDFVKDRSKELVSELNSQLGNIF